MLLILKKQKRLYYDEYEETNKNEGNTVIKTLKESGLESYTLKDGKDVVGNSLSKDTIAVWGGSYNTHPYRDSQDSRIPLSKVVAVLTELGLSDKYDVKTETYDPGSEKGWKVRAQYHYLIPKEEKDKIKKSIQDAFKSIGVE
jgi:hypothetical protein